MAVVYYSQSSKREVIIVTVRNVGIFTNRAIAFLTDWLIVTPRHYYQIVTSEITL